MSLSAVEKWLRFLDKEEYSDSFIDNGYDDLETLKLIEKEDLEAIGVMKKDHQDYLLAAVKVLKEKGAAWVYLLYTETTEEEHECLSDKYGYESGSSKYGSESSTHESFKNGSGSSIQGSSKYGSGSSTQESFKYGSSSQDSFKFSFYHQSAATLSEEPWTKAKKLKSNYFQQDSLPGNNMLLKRTCLSHLIYIKLASCCKKYNRLICMII